MLQSYAVEHILLKHSSTIREFLPLLKFVNSLIANFIPKKIEIRK